MTEKNAVVLDSKDSLVNTFLPDHDHGPFHPEDVRQNCERGEREREKKEYPKSVAAEMKHKMNGQERDERIGKEREREGRSASGHERRDGGSITVHRLWHRI